jgi:energy-coupling factor transporter ATP-binding protein EcfA2
MTTTAASLRLAGIQKSFGATRALRGVSLEMAPGEVHALIGENGVGKTNLLEAISLLAPGRGLRGARNADLRRIGATGWAVNARIQTAAGETSIGTGSDGESDRRVFQLDGATPRNQSEAPRPNARARTRAAPGLHAARASANPSAVNSARPQM